MTVQRTFRIALACAAMLASGAAVTAQDTEALTTREEVRTEISEAMDAVAAYGEQERDAALAEARAAFARLDAEIERREHALRENWSEMSQAARETAREQLQDLRAARTRLAERYGALEAGASSAWDELQAGFSDAWTAFSDAWSDADGNSDTSGN